MPDNPQISADPDYLTLSVLGARQKLTLWCWAACTESITDHHDVAIEQCDQVNELFTYADCCDWPPPYYCNKAANASQIEQNFRNCGYLYHPPTRSLAFADIIAEVGRKNQPIKAAIKFIDMYGSKIKGHVVVVCGFDQVRGYITYMDPTYGNNEVIPFADFLSNTGELTFVEAWLGIRPNLAQPQQPEQPQQPQQPEQPQQPQQPQPDAPS